MQHSQCFFNVFFCFFLASFCWPASSNVFKQFSLFLFPSYVHFEPFEISVFFYPDLNMKWSKT